MKWRWYDNEWLLLREQQKPTMASPLRYITGVLVLYLFNTNSTFISFPFFNISLILYFCFLTLYTSLLKTFFSYLIYLFLNHDEKSHRSLQLLESCLFTNTFKFMKLFIIFWFITIFSYILAFSSIEELITKKEFRAIPSLTEICSIYSLP